VRFAYAMVSLSALLQGCASLGDPLAASNRRVFALNAAIDEALGGSATGGGDTVIGPFTTVVKNVAGNMREPLNFTNAILQGRACAAGVSLRRFLTNSTIGLGGIVDVAKDYGGLEAYKTDFGITLGIWGVPSGDYVVLPLFGPADERGVAGLLVEYAVDPVDLPIALWGSAIATWSTNAVRVAGDILDASDYPSDTYEHQKEGYEEERDRAIAHYECPSALQGPMWQPAR